MPGFPQRVRPKPPEELTFGDPATGDHKEGSPPWDEHERTWDPCAQQWQDTPLAKWARSAGQVNCAAPATVCDNIDTIPPEDEPVFFTDGSAETPICGKLSRTWKPTHSRPEHPICVTLPALLRVSQ